MTTVLVVDDDEDLLRMFARALRRHGFEVTTASHGRAALEAVGSTVPDLIVSDVSMPELDGPSLLRELRARGIGVPVVFLTGYASHSDDNLMTLGASAVLGKPLSIETLVTSLKGLS